MTEKEFMKQVAESEMPDMDDVRESCIVRLKEEKKRQGKRQQAAVYGKAAIATVLLLCLCIPPINSFARQQIKVLLKLNDDEVQIGETQENIIHVPDGCTEEELAGGVTCWTKSYNKLSDVVKDIDTDIYTWQGADKFDEDGILLNIVDNDYSTIALFYDVDQANDSNQAYKDELETLYMLIYIPLSKETSLGDLMLENKQLMYSTVDDEGNIEEYKENTEYELIEQYYSPKLNTTVTVIESKVTTDMDAGAEDSTDDIFMYYLYFTLDGMCYQVGCDGTLDTVHRVVEEIGKSDLKAIKKKQGLSEENDSVNDLLYREIDGDSISVEKGEEVTLSPVDGKSYKDVTVYLIGKGTVMEVGDFSKNKTCCFTADVSGEYAIYSGDKNITSEVVVDIGKKLIEDEILYID